MTTPALRRTKRAVLLIGVFVSTAVLPGRAQVDRQLFSEAAPPISVTATVRPEIVRQRWVRVDFDRLRESLPASPGGAAGAPLVLNLFPDASVTAVLSRIEPSSTGYVWIGQVQGVAASSVTLVITGDIVVGNVTTPDAMYAIRSAGDGIHAIHQINSSALPRESPPVEPPTAGLDSADRVFPAADDGSEIDVLVVYTPSARIQEGGTAAIHALIDLGISETNQAYANSGAIQRIRLVHREEIAYTESGDMGIDLPRLQNSSDGYLDNVHALRNTYGADLVQLIENSSDSCGIAYVMTSQSASFASFAFGITDYSCVSPNYSFAHEMGHNMGLKHDVYVSPESGAFAYSHGYVNQAAFAAGASATKRWRDVMAYNDQCDDQGFFCTRLLNFSNPNLAHTGDPMGNAATADAVRSLDNTRVTVANFRPSATPAMLSINDVSVIEGNAGTRNASFTVSLAPARAVSTVVNYTTVDGTASTGGADYVAASGTLTIPPGSTSGSIVVAVNGDAAFEPAETFTVELTPAAGATASDGIGVATVRNDDFTDHPLTVGFLIRAAHITELRATINAERAARGVASFGFTDTTLIAQNTTVRAVHIGELRTALSAFCSNPSYTDPTLIPGVTTVKAAHIMELRSALLACQ